MKTEKVKEHAPPVAVTTIDPLDERLRCTECGERGELRACPGSILSPGYYITAKRDGHHCCQSQTCPSEEEAIARWEKHWSHET